MPRLRAAIAAEIERARAEGRAALIVEMRRAAELRAQAVREAHSGSLSGLEDAARLELEAAGLASYGDSPETTAREAHLFAVKCVKRAVAAEARLREIEAQLAEVTAQRDAARARVAEFEVIAEVIRKHDGGRLVDECKRFFESLSSRDDLLGALETLLPKHAAPEGQHVEQPELWLVMIQHGSKPGTHHKLAIGPWPSTSRRDVAEAAWKFDPQTIEVQRVEARPVDADEYVEPRLTTAERRAMERRRWLLRGPAVLSFPEDIRR